MHEHRGSILGRFAGLLLGLATLVIVAGSQPAEAAPRKCTARSEIKIKRLNRDALDELDRWRLTQAKAKLRDALLVAAARHCRRSHVLATTYAIRGVVEARERKYKRMKVSWTKAICIHRGVKIPPKLLSPKVQRMFRAVKARVRCKRLARPRPGMRPRRGSRVAPAVRRKVVKPPKRFEHVPPATWKAGRRLVLFARSADKLKAKKIKIFYRTKKKGKLKQALFTRGGPDRWSWRFSLSGVHMYVKAFYYFLVVYDGNGRPLAASGNALQLIVIKMR